MSLTIHLPPDLDRRLAELAAREGLSPGDRAARVVAERLSQEPRPASLASMIKAWIKEDENERDDAGAVLRSVDADRSSNRPLYPPDKKGVTW